MNISVLKQKQPIIIDGKEFIDLSPNCYKNDNIYSSILGYDVVTPDTAMRIDIIALKWYGSTEYIDILLKANNIFNPFSIQADDVLVIPNIKSLGEIFRTPGELTQKDIRKDIIKNQTVRSDVSKLESIANKNKNKKNRLKNPLPPNMLAVDDSNRLVGNGMINLTNNK